MREALKQAIRRGEDQKQACPQCGEQQRRLQGTVRRARATTFGRVEGARRRLRGLGWWQRWCPATQLCTEWTGGPLSHPLQEAAMLAGCAWPSRLASGLLKRLSGAHIRAEEMRLLTHRGGQRRAAQPHEEAERVCSAEASAAPSPAPADQPLLVGVAGGWVCSRDQRGGREGKVAVVCSQMEDLPLPTSSTTVSWSPRAVPRHPPRHRHRLAQRRDVATCGPSRRLGQQAKAAAQTRCGDPSRPVVLVADGAPWSTPEHARHLPQATWSLDWAQRWREVR